MNKKFNLMFFKRIASEQIEDDLVKISPETMWEDEYEPKESDYSEFQGKSSLPENSLVITEDKPGIYHVRCSAEPYLAMIFARMSCFYELNVESIKGNYFSLEKLQEEYKKWKGDWTFTSDWGAFNVPGHKVKEFFDTFYQPKNNRELNEYENAFFEKLFDIVPEERWNSGNFYVIGSYHKYSTDYSHPLSEHEFAHALWYMCPEYKEEMMNLINKWEGTDDIINVMREYYHGDVLIDELQARLATWNKKYFSNKPGTKSFVIPRDFREVFLKYIS